MGAEASKPRPGTKLQVIGAGLPRTGTASFAAALSILLDAPIYHCGTQTILSGEEFHIKSWTNILKHTPYKTSAEKDHVLQNLSKVLDGYAAVVDTPAGQFVPELMELYPDAKVICTVRDPEAWAKSLDDTRNASLQSFLGILVFWVPGVRFAPAYFKALQAGRWGELYANPGDEWTTGIEVWEKHMVHLRAVVPKEKLVFYDVREGWEPLCRILGVEVPKGVEFPRINDGKAIETLARKNIQRGLMRWAVVLGVVSVVVGTAWVFWRG